MAQRLTTKLAVCGLHLRQQPLNFQLTELGAKFLKECHSSPNYRLFALPPKEGKPSKPGMIYTPSGGQSVYLEIWEIEVDKLGHFMLKVPPPLAIGTVQLQNKDKCLGFVAEGWIADDTDSIDITDHGSWLAYLSSLEHVNHDGDNIS